MPARNIFIGALILVVAGFISYLHATGKYGLTALFSAILFLALGCICAGSTNRLAFQKQSNSYLLFTALISLCFFLLVYFINRQANSSTLMIAAVYTSCFLLPFIILMNWYLYKTAFQPDKITPWLLPVPYVKSNAISLHLNSIYFVFRIKAAPGVEDHDYPVTAPGIKMLGMVFSELVYEGRTVGQPDDFSDIKESSQGWMFYVRELGGLNNRQLDANLSLIDNRLKNNVVVMVQHY